MRHAPPPQTLALGVGRLAYAAPGPLRAEYEGLLREEAFGEMQGLRATHACVAGNGGAAAYLGGGGGGGGSSMRRHMRVSAEMSSLSSLAVHWGSSVLVRQDPGRRGGAGGAPQAERPGWW